MIGIDIIDILSFQFNNQIIKSEKVRGDKSMQEISLKDRGGMTSQPKDSFDITIKTIRTSGYFSFMLVSARHAAYASA